MKTYIQPQARVINFMTESAMLANSYEVSKDKTTNTILSKDKEWGSNDWSDADED